MKTYLIIAVLCHSHVYVVSPRKPKKKPRKMGVTRAGNISLLFSQAAFNEEWTGGGTNNYAG